MCASVVATSLKIDTSTAGILWLFLTVVFILENSFLFILFFEQFCFKRFKKCRKTMFYEHFLEFSVTATVKVAVTYIFVDTKKTTIRLIFHFRKNQTITVALNLLHLFKCLCFSTFRQCLTNCVLFVNAFYCYQLLTYLLKLIKNKQFLLQLNCRNC